MLHLYHNFHTQFIIPFIYKIYVNSITILMSCPPKHYWSVNSFLTICPPVSLYFTEVSLLLLNWHFIQKYQHSFLFKTWSPEISNFSQMTETSLTVPSRQVNLYVSRLLKVIKYVCVCDYWNRFMEFLISWDLACCLVKSLE